MVDFENKDYSKFVELFEGSGFEKIDLVYYFHSVSDWSDQSDTKRHFAGWIATVRNFIRGDSQKNRLKLKPEFVNSNKSVNRSEAMQFFKDED